MAHVTPGFGRASNASISVHETEIPAVKVITPLRLEDNRGAFSETYHHLKYSDLGIGTVFVQDNLSRSYEQGTIRGLHFQLPPFAQDKLVRVAWGAILDVAVDLRRASPTFGRHVCVRMTADEGSQIFVPAGFAHGFCTLTPDTQVIYKVSHYYAPTHEAGIHWDDPDVDVKWPVGRPDAILSEKDRNLPRLGEVISSLPF